MMLWYDDNMGWWGYAGMGIGMVSFWALLIVGIVALVRYTATNRPTPPFPTRPPTPEEVLADRFARGEIDRRAVRDPVATTAPATTRAPTTQTRAKPRSPSRPAVV
jgi:putative membrane protein